METSPAGLYVTGTDTGVGKTVVSVALLQALREAGASASGFKPVASGCEQTEQGWRNDDALALQAASRPAHPYDRHNPYALPEPTAPQLAARRAGVEVSLERLQQAFARLAAEAEFVLVEGAGGWLAPLADGLEQSALARALGLPVLLVVGVRLGCLNHARLSERAILADGLSLSGWIGNVIDPAFADAGHYRALLQSSLGTPCLGWLPHGGDRSSRPAHLAEATATLRLSAGARGASPTVY